MPVATWLCSHSVSFINWYQLVYRFLHFLWLNFTVFLLLIGSFTWWVKYSKNKASLHLLLPPAIWILEYQVHTPWFSLISYFLSFTMEIFYYEFLQHFKCLTLVLIKYLNQYHKFPASYHRGLKQMSICQKSKSSVTTWL